MMMMMMMIMRVNVTLMSDNKQVLIVCVARLFAQLLTLQQLVELINTSFVTRHIALAKIVCFRYRK